MQQMIIESRDGLQVLTVSGELDTFGAQAFRDKLSGLRSADRFAIDLGPLSFIDSAGLHALFSVGRIAKEVGASVVFVVPLASPVRRVIDLVQLADVTPVCDELHVAISRLQDARGAGFEAGDAG